MNLQNFPHDIQYCPIKISNCKCISKVFNIIKILFFKVIYNQTQVRLVWDKFEARDQYYPTLRIRFWWTSDCPGWENPMPVRIFFKIYFKTNFDPRKTHALPEI